MHARAHDRRLCPRTCSCTCAGARACFQHKQWCALAGGALVGMVALRCGLTVNQHMVHIKLCTLLLARAANQSGGCRSRSARGVCCPLRRGVTPMELPTRRVHTVQHVAHRLWGHLERNRLGEHLSEQVPPVPFIIADAHGASTRLLWRAVEYAKSETANDFKRVIHTCELGQRAGVCVGVMALRWVLPISVVDIVFSFLNPAPLIPRVWGALVASYAPLEPDDSAPAWTLVATRSCLTRSLKVELRIARTLDAYLQQSYEYQPTSVRTCLWAIDLGLDLGTLRVENDSTR